MAPSSSKGKTDISKSIVDLYELDDAIEKTIAIITRREKVAIDLIGKLKSEKYRTLLILYYIAGDEPKTWEEVAREMNYSVYTLWHDHGNALQEYQNLMNDNMAENSS